MAVLWLPPPSLPWSSVVRGPEAVAGGGATAWGVCLPPPRPVFPPLPLLLPLLPRPAPPRPAMPLLPHPDPDPGPDPDPDPHHPRVWLALWASAGRSSPGAHSARVGGLRLVWPPCGPA
ncbi:uncharacterized protein LAJ45_06012 [Morchella importuna]|uniref:uncharacterized protein n=1 Tax=Morchella importuna TaxID=1174673 RepID=UPI001E8E0DD0|nr:uncharacterized protein LAJ45_06012 [Morchella importuna]KAH8149860.1 hypothetical protein LAJ45_06012 [Morchella importuna]